ncbi:MAG: glycosyltransferase family 4 protein [Patescibacteria group bacterium]|nr:glycosyltransferase family 4 protein [Patescibacteria group bacterium]
MPVLHYPPVIGGLELWTQNIAERLSEKFEIFVATGKVKGERSIEIRNGVKIFRTSLFTLKNLSYSSPIYIFTTLPFIFFKTLNLIKREKINLIHCQGFLSSLLGYFLCKLTSVPYLITIQGLEENKNILKKIVYKRASFCIVASSAIKNYFEKIGVKNIEIIPNGINLERFKNINPQKSREELGLKDEFVIMTIARLEKVKGIEYLIKAFNIVKSQIVNCKLLIIGEGSERKNLENLVEKLNLKNKVKFLGQIPNEKIPEYLSVADCFVLPSLKEGFGIAILEAQAAGVPAVATKVGGIPDIIRDEETGILVEPKNSQVIAQAIIKIFSDPEFGQSLVQNAKANLEKYNWSKIAQRINAIYQKLLKIILAAGIFPPDIGGPAIYTERLSIELFQQGFDVEVITYSNFKHPTSNIQNPKIKILRISRGHPKGLRHFLYFLNLLKKARDVDVIYAQNPISAGFPAMLVSKILRKKFILKIVGDYAWEQGRAKWNVKENLEEFQDKKYDLKVESLRKIQKFVAKNANKIIVPSYYLKKIITNGWQIPEDKVTVIYNAVEDFFSNFSKREAKQKIGIEGDIILSIGRLMPWKGFKTLIEIMPDLLKENPNFRLVIVGEGPEKINLKSQISNLKLNEKIKLVGNVNHSEIPLYLKAADLFVLNSGYEGLSHVILEAMQAELPIITTDIGGNLELIENGKNGILIGYNNKEQLKEAILKLWKDKALQNKFIENSKQKLIDFSWENLVKKTLEILKK